MLLRATVLKTADTWQVERATSLQVKLWARHVFLAEVQQSRPDAAISLAKASMLIGWRQTIVLLQMLSLDLVAPADILLCHEQALEEEAAAEALHATNPPLMEQLVQRHVRLKGTRSEREWERTSGISEAPILWHVLAQMLAGTSLWAYKHYKLAGDHDLYPFCHTGN